jgi:hypothetical protein
MPARRFSSKHRRRNKARSSLPAVSGEQFNRLLEAVETERDRLSRAESLLGCLTIAMEYGEMPPKEPYYPDVAEIVREMLRKSISALDPIKLPSSSRDKVKEEFSAKDCAPASAHELPLLPCRIFRFARPRSPRLHRRNYSRFSARKASNMDSACANISG